MTDALRCDVPVCPQCRAVGLGNATCRWCVARWPAMGIATQDSVDRMLRLIGDRLPDPPFGTLFH